MSARLYGMVVVCALLVAVYTMSHSSKFHVVDEVSLFSITESVALRGEVDTNTIAWSQWVNSPGEVLGAFGSDGEVYSKKGPAPAILAVPWYLFLRTLAQLDITVGLLQGTLLWNGVVTALTALVLWWFARTLGYRERTGAGLVLLFGLGTIAWPYANQFFGEPLSALALFGCFAALVRWLRTRGRVMWAAVAGIAAGVAVTTVTAHTLLIAVMALYAFGLPLWLAQRSRQSVAQPAAVQPAGGLVLPRGWFSGVVAFAAPLLLANLLLLLYNYMRFGNPFETGYHFDSGEGFSTPIWEGLWGLLVSPYRGVFWFTPLFFASVAAWFVFRRRHRHEAIMSGAVSLVLILLYSMWWMWWAGFAWGPRFLVPLAPFWVLWLAPWMEQVDGALQAWRPKRGWRTLTAHLGRGGWLLLVLTPISFIVQVAAVVVNFVNFEIRLRDLYPTDWENPLAFGPPAQSILALGDSPVVGQFRLMRSNFVANTDLAWLWSDGNVQLLLFAIGGAVLLTLTAAFVQWWLAEGRATERISAERWLPSTPVRSLLPILPLLLIVVWLGEVAHNPHYGDPERGYRAIIRDICASADGDDAIVTVAPFAYQIPMNWLGGECKEPIPMFGLAPSSMEYEEAGRMMRDVLARYNRVWLVTGGLPPNDPENTVEQWLASEAYKANDTWYEDFRLVDYGTATLLQHAPETPLNATLVGAGTSQITLIAARVPSLSLPGRVLPVDVRYQLQDQNDQDLRWFVQLLRPEGNPAAMLDTGPEDGYLPFSQLPANEELIERAGLLLPDNLPPGRYEVIAGLYNPALEGAPRLRTPDGSDFVRLGMVEVR